MARARNIKPAFFQNDALGEIAPLGRLLFIGMWTIADFKGCMEYRPKRIKAQLLPYDECDIEALAIALEKSGFIASYSVRGQTYLKITNFERHQNPHKNEREAGSDFPDIMENDSEINELKKDGTTRDKNGSAPADSLIPHPDSLNLIPDIPQAETHNPQPTKTIVGKPDRRKEHRASADVLEVFNYWRKVMNHEHAKLDDKRAKVIGKRLSDGYTVGDLCRAVDGCRRSPHHMGQNDTHTVYDDIELICRDGPKVDGFIKRANTVPQPARTTNQQQTIDNLQAYLEQNG